MSIYCVAVVCTAMSCELDAFDNCFITFPLLHNDCDKDDLTELNYESDIPVVILLGWTGCKQRHLKKYRAIYEKTLVSKLY